MSTTREPFLNSVLNQLRDATSYIPFEIFDSKVTEGPADALTLAVH